MTWQAQHLSIGIYEQMWVTRAYGACVLETGGRIRCTGDKWRVKSVECSFVHAFNYEMDASLSTRLKQGTHGPGVHACTRAYEELFHSVHFNGTTIAVIRCYVDSMFIFRSAHMDGKCIYLSHLNRPRRIKKIGFQKQHGPKRRPSARPAAEILNSLRM